jgi:hypothetical protein
MLLPWHVNGTLEPAEAAWFEAHLAQCAECSADLAADRKLRSHVASLPLDIEPVNPPVFDRIAAISAQRGDLLGRVLRKRVALGWAIAGQAAAAAAVAAFVVLSPAQQDRGYDLLGSPPQPTSGNAIVLFAPDATERQVRDALIRNGLRIVDGPTASGAYVVRAPSDARSEALEHLRQMPQVILAEPLDRGDGS